MKITKIVVSKGASIELPNLTWVKVNYELTAIDEFKNEAAIHKGKAILEKILDGWIQKAPKARSPPKTPQKKKTVTKPPQIQNINNGMPENPWTNYNRQPCKKGEEGWAKAENVPEDIVNILSREMDLTNRADWIQMGLMEYRLSGTNFRLVNRRPLGSKKK